MHCWMVLCDLLCAAHSMVPGAWSLSCADCQLFVLIVSVPCLLCSLAVPGVWGFLRVTHLRLHSGDQERPCRRHRVAPK